MTERPSVSNDAARRRDDDRVMRLSQLERMKLALELGLFSQQLQSPPESPDSDE